MVWTRPTWNPWAAGDRKTPDPHGKVKNLMSRACIHVIENIGYLWLRRNPSLTEMSIFKARVVRLLVGRTWNQKNLDYEIETEVKTTGAEAVDEMNLKSKESRLRDWNLNTLTR